MLSASAELAECRRAADTTVHEVVGNGDPIGNLIPVKIIRQKGLITVYWIKGKTGPVGTAEALAREPGWFA